MFKLLAAGTAAVMAFAGSAQATTTLISTSSNVPSSDGNRRSFQVTSFGKTVNVRVSGWSLDSSGIVRDSKLPTYGSAGFGVISGDDDGGRSNQHTVDNHDRIDFVLFQFDQDVKLTGARFNGYGLFGGPEDTDATIAWAHTDLAWNEKPGWNDQSITSVLGTLQNPKWLESLGGTDQTRTWKPSGFGNIWFVAASGINADGKVDGFKLNGVQISAVPEPASWVMMIGGFGLAGAAARRRQGARVLA